MILAALAALVGAALQSTTSFGYALVLAPVLLAVTEPAEAIATILALAATLNLMMLFGEGRRPDPRGRRVEGRRYVHLPQ